MNEPVAKPERTGRTPTWKRDIALHTEFAQRVYRRTWDHLKADIFILTVRARTLDFEEAAQTSEKFIQEQFAKAKQDLTSELQRTEVLLEQSSITEMPQYPALNVSAEYTSPHANEFLKLIELMDQVLKRIDALWLNGEVDTRQRTARAYEWQRRLMKIANRLRDLGGRGRASMFKQVELRKATHRKETPATASTGANVVVNGEPGMGEVSAGPVTDAQFEELIAEAEDATLAGAMERAETEVTKPNGKAGRHLPVATTNS